MAEPSAVLQTDPKHAQSVLWYGKLLLTCGQDKAIKAWDGDALAWQLDGHEATSYGLSLHNDRLLSGGSDHTLRCWDLVTRKALWVAKGIDHGTWSPDGTHIVVHKANKRVAVLDAAGEQTHLLPQIEKRVWSSGWWNGSVLLGGAKDIHVVTDGEVTGTWVGHEDMVTNLSTGPDLVASAGRDGQLLFWQDGRIVGRHQAPPGIGLCWDGAGKHVARSSDGHLAVHAAPSGEVTWSTDVPLKGVYGPGFSPDGKRLAVACADGAVRIYDLS